MGSTSYDEAREHTDATWSGASWYGPTSGEYWIVNPREYADPRKHGPGYQQRAGRTAVPGGAGAASTEADDSGERAFEPGGEVPVEEPLGGKARASRAEAPADRPEAEASARTASEREAGRWRASARPAWTAAADEPGGGTGELWVRRGRDWPGDGGPADPLGSLGAAGRDLLGTPTDDPIRRLGLALVAWPPIGLAAAAAIGDITGCSVYSAECAGSDSLLPWLAQAAILGLLLLLPPLARLFVGGTVGILLALTPITVVLLAVGAGGAPQAGFVLALLLAAAWLIGVTWAARGATRAPRPAS